MDKYIAFNLYRKNELGGHVAANETQQDVYLATDVEALRPFLEEIASFEPGTLWRLVDEIKINNAAKQALALMVK